MINKDGKLIVYTVTEYYENDSCLISIHDTSDGAAKALSDMGYRYMTAGPDGWYGHGWYKHVKEGARDTFYKGAIAEAEVRA